jgi:glucose-6-phosphate 1-epimerase
LEDDAESLALWPHAFRLRLDLELGSDLRLTLCADNPGAQALPWQAAFHPYLSVKHLPDSRILGLGGLSFRSTKTPGLSRQDTEELRPSGPVDRVYHHAADRCEVLDAEGRREFLVEKSGGRDTVVWTPGPGTGSNPADLPDDAWTHFLCVEALSSDEAGEIAPGASRSLSLRISA